MAERDISSAEQADRSSRGEEQVIEVVKLKADAEYYYKDGCRCSTATSIAWPTWSTTARTSCCPARRPCSRAPISSAACRCRWSPSARNSRPASASTPSLQVQRQMIDQTRTTQGGNQVHQVRLPPAGQQLQERAGQAAGLGPPAKGENESVGITLLKSSPELSKDGIYLRESRPNNLLRWDVEVAANCNGEKALPITYEFRMELDRQMAITGFQRQVRGRKRRRAARRKAAVGGIPRRAFTPRRSPNAIVAASFFVACAGAFKYTSAYLESIVQISAIVGVSGVFSDARPFSLHQIVFFFFF